MKRWLRPICFNEGDRKIRVSPASSPLLREFALSEKLGGTWQAAHPLPWKSCFPWFSSGVSAGKGPLSDPCGLAGVKTGAAARSHRLVVETMLRTYCARARCTRSSVITESPNAIRKSGA